MAIVVDEEVEYEGLPPNAGLGVSPLSLYHQWGGDCFTHDDATFGTFFGCDVRSA